MLFSPVNNCRVNRMHSYAVAFTAFLMLLNASDCRLHRRSHLLRRRYEPVFQTPNQAMPPPPPNYQNQASPNSEYGQFPNSLTPATPGNVFTPPLYPPGASSSFVYNSPSVFPPPLPSPQYQNSNFQNSPYQYQPPASSKRRRKNITDNAVEKLLDKGKKMLEAHPMRLEKKIPDNPLEDFEKNGNATVISIPKGVQLKTFSDLDDHHVKNVINISSTQRTLSVDNNTEIENVVEMQMEKKVEDEKGDNKGSEEVRIVETELVKPIGKGELNNATRGKRHRRFHPWRFPRRRRGKRSEKDSEVVRSPSIYNKIAKRFLSDLKRNARIVERDTFLNPQEASNSGESEFRGIKSKAKEVSGKPTKSDSLYDNDELGEFLKHFLDQLKKFKRIRENIGNKVQHVEFSNTSGNWTNTKQAKHAKRTKHHEYPEHVKIVMNFNMTLDTKSKDQLIRSTNALQKPINYDVTTGREIESTNQGVKLKVLFINDGKARDGKFLTVLLYLSVVIFLLPILAWVFPKLYRTARLAPRTSYSEKLQRTYGFYQENGNEKVKALRNFRRENLCAQEYPQLEWQSENGDWLSDKELDFK